jgi:hypothetical protein
MASYRRIAAQVRIHAPTELSRWLYEAVRGAVIRLARPEPAAGIAAALVTTTIVATTASSGQVVGLFAATRQALTDQPTDAPARPRG